MVPNFRHMMLAVTAWLMARYFGQTPKRILQREAELRILRLDNDRLRCELGRAQQDLYEEIHTRPTLRAVEVYLPSETDPWARAFEARSILELDLDEDA